MTFRTAEYSGLPGAVSGTGRYSIPLKGKPQICTSNKVTYRVQCKQMIEKCEHVSASTFHI